MKLIKFHITDVLGITSFEADNLGNIVEISGDNDTNKSSIITALMSALKGGNPVEIIRKGCVSAEIVLEFDSGHVLTTVLDREKAPKRTIKKDGMRVERVAEWLASRINAMSFNPVQFVNATPQKRLEMLLSVTPLSVDYNDLLNACGPKWMPEEVTGNDSFLMIDPLQCVDSIYNRIFQNRTGLNRSIETLDGHIKSLQATLPALDENPDPEGIERKLKDAKDALDAEKEKVEKVDSDWRLKLSAAKSAAEITEQKRHEEEMRRIQTEYVAGLNKLAQETKNALGELNFKHTTDTAELREKLGSVRAKKEQLQQATGTRKTIGKATIERENQKNEVDRNTAALKALKDLRAKMLEKLPVAGLTIVDGQIMNDKGRGPIPYDTENEQTKIDIAMRLAAAGAGELKMIFMDGFEALSKKSRKLFRAWASKSEAQFFYCLVKDDAPLEVTSEPAAVAKLIQDGLNKIDPLQEYDW
jgi:hypothetical protein